MRAGGLGTAGARGKEHEATTEEAPREKETHADSKVQDGRSRRGRQGGSWDRGGTKKSGDRRAPRPGGTWPPEKDPSGRNKQHNTTGCRVESMDGAARVVKRDEIIGWRRPDAQRLLAGPDSSRVVLRCVFQRAVDSWLFAASAARLVAAASSPDYFVPLRMTGFLALVNFGTRCSSQHSRARR